MTSEPPRRCRFPPEPSGYLHIGHVKAAYLNYTTTPDNLLVRMDDTNPSKENEHFVKIIKEDLEKLNIKYAQLSHSSDYFEDLLKYADRMLEEGTAYADDTSKEEMQAQRMDGIASKRRDNTVEKNKEMWEKMKTGEAQDTCLRAKMSVDNLNKAMRDPVIYRVNLTPHLRTGDKYKVYPTYDFVTPILDSNEGVTECYRTSEYNDRNDQYKWFIEKLKLRPVKLDDFSRLNMEYTVMSKRKLTELVNNGTVRGWDDPRFPTVRGLLRRGVHPDALKEFVTAQGFSKVINVMEWNKLWNINKLKIDDTCGRYNCVDSFRVPVTIIDVNETTTKEVPLHKKNEALGTKTITYSQNIFLEEQDVLLLKEGEEVTLMDWGNAIIESIKLEDGKPVAATAKLHLEGDFKKTKWKLHWVADSTDNVPIQLFEFDNLLSIKSIDKETVVEQHMNPHTEFQLDAMAEPAVKKVKVGDRVQFQRRGYFICDSVQPYVFFNIPEGQQKLNHLSAMKRSGVKIETLQEKKQQAADQKKKQKTQQKAAADDLLPDIRVGKIVEIEKHPEADKLYCTKTDVGEAEPRSVVTGLVNFFPNKEDLLNRMVMVVCNLKAAPLKGVMSAGLIMSCVKSETEYETLPAPEGAKVGDRVVFPAEAGIIPDEIPKKKSSKVLDSMITDGEGVATVKTSGGVFPMAVNGAKVVSKFPNVPAK